MPIKGEKERKIRALRQGKNIRPPKKWWREMHRRIKREYPYRSPEDIDRITAGIWYDYPLGDKIRIVEEMQV